MASDTADIAAQLRDALNELIVRRTHIGLAATLASVLLFWLGDHVLEASPPPWTDVINPLAVALVLAGFWGLRQPAVLARPVPFALLLVALAYTLRSLAGIWFDEVAPTAILCAVVALGAGATLPWGMWAQLASVLMAGAAIAVNAAYVGSQVAESIPHLAAAVLTALAVSVVLSVELQRHHLRLFAENLQRRRAEDDLARLNAELERRVVERTAQLGAATQQLEREVLERQQAAHELRDSQRRLQDILDNAVAVIHCKDLDGRYALINRHFETVFGMPREAAIGKTPHDLFTAEIADALLANDRRVLSSRQPIQVEEILRPRGEDRTFLSVKFPLYDADGAPVGVCGIATDITERKSIEAELRRSEAALSALVENTSEAIWSVDLTGQVRVLNSVTRRRFEERFGEPFAGRTPSNMPQPLASEFQALYARAFAGERVQIERSFEERDGRHYYLTSVHPIIESGVVTGATVFSSDITELKRAEELARQRQAELAHVLRLGTMGEMAAGLAHEINQPLGAIANYAQGCARRLRAGSIDSAALLPVVEEIAGEALRAGEIIRRLRDLVRKESPQQDAVDVNGLVRDSMRRIEPEARKLGVHVQLDLAADLPLVACDGIQIEQVLLNLLLNGVEAVQTSGNGDRTLAVRTAAKGDGVEVAICDSGIGIPEPPTDVFAPFFTTKPNGLGMGLSISRSIIEAHGGELSAVRNPDHGSTFRFTLPAQAAQA
jgi:PAS domain S-box-containing protein